MSYSKKDRALTLMLLIGGGATGGLGIGLFIGPPWQWIGAAIGSVVGFHDWMQWAFAGPTPESGKQGGGDG